MSLIPFNNAFVPEEAISYLRQAIAARHLSGDGAFTRKCHSWLEQRQGCVKALLTTSCTHALEMAAVLLDIQPGDEVIIPAFTFVSTVNAFVLRGARPVFVDVRSDTCNLDERLVSAAVSSRTKAIVPVHYGGVACDMKSLMGIAEQHGISVVEDNAHGFLGGYRGQLLGSFGAMATQSFHETKNFHCGEGGALLINDPTLVDRAEVIREKGTDRSRFFRGQVDKYTWVDVGSSFLPSDALAAILYAQFTMADEIQAKRSAIWNRYATALADWAMDQGIQLPVVPPHCVHPAHLFYLIFPSLSDREKFIEYLRKRDIVSVFHYQALHTSPMGLRFGGRPGQCPVTERLANQLVRLPLYYGMSTDHLEQVISAVRAFRITAGRTRRELPRAA